MGKVQASSLFGDTQTAAPEQTSTGSLVDAGSLFEPVEKKNSGFEPITGVLNWVKNGFSQLNSDFASAGQKLNDWVLGKVKEQTGLQTDEEAISYINNRAQMRKAVDEYGGTLNQLGISKPDDFFNQSPEQLATWYFNTKDNLTKQAADITNAAQSRVPEYRGFDQSVQKIDPDEVTTPEEKIQLEQKNAQLKDLEQIKDKIIAPKLALLDDPRRIGFNYTRLFEPGKYDQIMRTLEKISPSLKDPAAAEALMQSGSDDLLFKAFPQGLLYEMEQQGLKIKAQGQVETLKDQHDNYAKFKLNTDRTIAQFDKAIAEAPFPETKRQLQQLRQQTIDKFNSNQYVVNYRKNLEDLTQTTADYWSLAKKYPDVLSRQVMQDWMDNNYKDQNVVVRQITGTPGQPGEPVGAVGFTGRFAKSFLGVGKDVLKSINAGIATLGLKDSDRAFFQNYEMDNDFETLFPAPTEQQSQVSTGFDIPESVRKVATDIGLNPDAMAFLGTPKAPTFNWGGITGTMGDITGQVMAQALIGRGTGAAFGQVVSDVGAGLKLAGANAATVNRALTYLKDPAFAQDRVGLFAGTYATTYGTNYNQAIDAGLEPDKAEQYAMVSSLGSAMTELINPDTKILRAAEGKMTGAAMRTVVDELKNANKKLGVAAALGKYLGEAGINVGKETLEEVIDQVKTHMLDAGYGVDTTGSDVVSDATNTAITTAIGMIPMALFGAYGHSSNLRKEALYKAGQDPLALQKYFDKKMQGLPDDAKGEYQTNVVDPVMTVARTMGEIVGQIPDTNMQGRKLTVEEKANLAELLFKTRKLRTDAKSMDDEVLRTPVDQQAAAAQAGARDILAGAAPAYIINGRAYQKGAFLDFLKDDDFVNNKKNFKLEVYNDDEALLAAQAATANENGNPQLHATEQYLLDQQKELQDQVIQLNSKIVELEQNDPQNPDLTQANSDADEANKQLRLVNERLEALRNKKAEVETSAANIKAISPEAAEQPEPVAGANIGQNSSTNAGVPVTRVQGQPLKGEFTPAEQAESDKVGTDVKQKFNNAPKMVSNISITKTLPGGQRLTGKYALVPAASITASHNPGSFASNTGFPTLAGGKNPNDRDYTKAENKSQVIMAGRSYDARAIDSMPTITPDGVVIDGNQRTMSGQIAAINNTDQAYMDGLKERLPFFGFSQEDLDFVGDHPRLVFVTDNVPEYTTQTFAQFNQQGMKEESPMSKAVKLGRVVDDSVFRIVGSAMEPFDTLGQFYQDKKATKQVFDTLVKNGVLLENELPRYFNSTARTVTESGKEFLESLMMGKVIDEDNLALLGKDGLKGLRAKIMRSMQQLSAIDALGGDYSLKDALNQMIRIKDAFETFKADMRDNNVSFGDFLAQRNIFQEDQATPEAVIMYHNSELSQKEFKDFLSRYQQAATDAQSGAQNIFDEAPGSMDSILYTLSQSLTNEQQQQVKSVSGQQQQSGEETGGGQPAAVTAANNTVQQPAGGPETGEGQNAGAQEQNNTVQQTAEGNRIENNSSPENTNQNATEQREGLQNQEVPPESGQQQHSGVNEGQQEQTGGQETQQGADNSNRPERGGSEPQENQQGQEETPVTASSVDEAMTKAIELLQTDEEKTQQLSLLDEFFASLGAPAPSSGTGDQNTKPPGTILRSVTVNPNSPVTVQAAKNVEEMQAKLEADHQKLLAAVGDRGPAAIIQAIDAAVASGNLPEMSGRIAKELINANPDLFKTLAIAISGNTFGKDVTLEGYYDYANEIVRVFTDANPENALHELLHHTENFLPVDIRSEIVREWYNQVVTQLDNFKRQEASATGGRKMALQHAINYLELALQKHAAETHEMKELIASKMAAHFGVLGQSFYDVFDPSEWWAANATRIFRDQQNAERPKGFFAKIKEFFTSLLRAFKKIVGANPVSAVERGLNAILNGAGIDYTGKLGVLSDSKYNYALKAAYINQQEDKARTAVETMLPAGILSFDDVLARVLSRNALELLPFIAKGYKDVRDGFGSRPISPAIQGLMSDNLTVDRKANAMIGTSDPEIAAIANMYYNRVQFSGQSIPDAVEEMKLLPISRDKRTAIMDNFNRQVQTFASSLNPTPPLRDPNALRRALEASKKFGKKWLTVGGLVPKAIRDLKEMETGFVNEWTVKIKHVQQDFERAVKEAYNGKPTPAQTEAMDEALRNPAKAAGLPPVIQNALNNMRNFIDALTGNLEKNGVIPALDVADADLENAKLNNAPAETIKALQFRRELALTVENRMGTYINRQYEKFRNTAFAEKIAKDDVKKQAAINFLTNVALINNNTAPTTAELENTLQAIINSEDADMALQAAAMNMDASVLMHMEDIPVQIRDLMGEIKDAEWNFVNTTIKMASLLERHKFLNNMFSAGAGTIFTANGQPNIALGLTAKINKPYWGPLHNQYTTPELKEALENWNRSASDNSYFMNALRSATSWAKSAKTSLSVTSEIRNVIGNGVMLFQNGNFSPSEFGNGLKAIKDLFGKVTDPAARDFLERMARLNITNQNIPSHEINSISTELFNMIPNATSWDLPTMKKIGRRLNLWKTKMGELYGATDDVFKIITFMTERQKLEEAYNKSNVAKSAEALDREAADITTRIMPTFYKVPAAIRGVAQHVPLFGNFVSYPVELLRTTYNTVQLAFQQMRDSNPEIRKIGAKRLTWFLGTQIGTSILPLALSFLPRMLGMYGADGDDRDALFDLMPEYYRNNAANVYKAENGHYLVHFMNGLDGQDWFKQIVLGAIRGDGFEHVTRPIEEFLAPFTSQNMVVQKYNQWVKNEDQYGKPLYNEEDSETNKGIAFAKHWGDLVNPQTIADLWKMGSSFMGGKEEKGWLTLLKITTGQSVLDFDANKQIQYQAKEFDFRLREAMKIKNEDDKRAAIDRIRLEKKNFLNKMRPLRD